MCMLNKLDNISPFNSKKIKKAKEIVEKFKNESKYFEQAFTHTSYLNENNLEKSNSYETLEFLGDSILNFYVSLYIYIYSSKYSEGQMSKMKQLMVKQSTLSYLSLKIELGNYVKLGSGERKNKGANRDSILADIFESFLASVYLEKGGEEVWNFLSLTVFSWIKGKEKLIWDYKSQLQEYCQANKIKLYYDLKSEIKKKQNSLFVIEVVLEFSESLDKNLLIYREKGTGSNKKEAEQKAASKIIKKLKINSNF